MIKTQEDPRRTQEDAQFTAFTAFGGHASHTVHAAPVAHHAVHAARVDQHAVHHAPLAHHAVHHAAPVVHHAAYHTYGHNYCKDVAQETWYSVPVLTVVEPTVAVIYPEPIRTCVNKPISPPSARTSEEKCITVHEIEVVSEAFEKCVTSLTDPACQAVELTLPKQVCKEINYGYAEDTPTEAEPVYEAPAPVYVAAPAPAGGQPRGG